ncbi:hypothetical protein D3C81_871070 [compost metagenome]
MRGHADQRAHQAVDHAVDTCGGASVLGDLLVTGGEHPLPDVLADQDAEEVDQEVGDDGVPADGGQAEVTRRQLGHQLIPATDLVQADGQQDEHQADGLDHELDDVGQGQRPHAADGRIDHYHATTEQDRAPERQVEQHLQDGADSQGRSHRDHQRVGKHDHCTGLAGHGVVAFFQHLGDGENLQAQQRLGQEQVQGDDAQAQCRAQPETGNPVDIAQANGADGRRAAQYRGGHGAHVQAWAEVAPGYQVIFMGFCPAHAEPAEREHAGRIDQNNEYVQGHGCLQLSLLW